VNPSTAVEYLLIVDTNLYAGNFEREMTAFATGVLGECEVGDTMLEDFFEGAAAFGYDVDPDDMDAESPFIDLMVQKDDGEGCQRPCSISMQNGEYNSVEMYMDQRPAERDLAFIVERIRAFPAYSAQQQFGQKSLKILGIRLICRSITTTDEVLVSL
jgi:hypothetical protein